MDTLIGHLFAVKKHFASGRRHTAAAGFVLPSSYRSRTLRPDPASLPDWMAKDTPSTALSVCIFHKSGLHREILLQILYFYQIFAVHRLCTSCLFFQHFLYIHPAGCLMRITASESSSGFCSRQIFIALSQRLQKAQPFGMFRRLIGVPLNRDQTLLACCSHSVWNGAAPSYIHDFGW